MTTDATIQNVELTGGSAKSLARYLPSAARILMGLLFFASGISGLLMATGLVAQPASSMPAGATAFLGAMVNSGYLFWLVKGSEAVVGLLLLSNRLIPLALTVLAPVIVNILAFHAFLAPSGLGPAVVLVALEGYLAWVYRAAYRPLFVLRASPSVF